MGEGLVMILDEHHNLHVCAYLQVQVRKNVPGKPVTLAIGGATVARLAAAVVFVMTCPCAGRSLDFHRQLGQKSQEGPPLANMLI